MAKKRRRPPKRYDLEMIRDFLEHLTWEVRVKHFENVAKRGTINPELCDQLRKHIHKYGGAALLPETFVHCDNDVSDVERERALKEVAKTSRNAAQEHLDHIEALTNLFGQALSTAEYCYLHGVLPRITINAKEVLEQMDDPDLDADC